jgi:hypothetical protein
LLGFGATGIDDEMGHHSQSLTHCKLSRANPFSVTVDETIETSAIVTRQ